MFHFHASAWHVSACRLNHRPQTLLSAGKETTKLLQTPANPSYLLTMYITHRRWFDFVWLRYCAVDIELNFGRSHHWTKSLFPCCHSYLGAQFQLRGAIVCHSYRGDIPSYGRYYHGCARWSNHFLPGMLLGTCVVCLTPLAEVHIIGLWCSWTGRSYLYECYRKKSPLGFVQNLRDALAGVSISWWWFTLDFSFSFFLPVAMRRSCRCNGRFCHQLPGARRHEPVAIWDETKC